MNDVVGRSASSVLRSAVREVRWALGTLLLFGLLGFVFAIFYMVAVAYDLGLWWVDPRLPSAFWGWVRPLLFIVTAYSFLLTLLRWASLGAGVLRRTWPSRVFSALAAFWLLWVLSDWVVVDGLIVMCGTGIVLCALVAGVRSLVRYWRSEREWRDSDLDTLGGYVSDGSRPSPSGADGGSAAYGLDRDRLGSVEGR